nr:hypothetical protein [Kibdelosporangium sp. MJ126-NF4]CTQ90731.1 hypothetical protein [Kibdelosporangium sp. MJ126-NF4]
MFHAIIPVVSATQLLIVAPALDIAAGPGLLRQAFDIDQ